MAVWMLFQISFKLFPSIAVLYRVPESKIKGFRGSVCGRRRRRVRR